ncbi:hypothetical protein D3C72_1322510 [compost metagenome]
MAGGRQRAPAVEQAQLVPGGQIAAAVVGVVEVQVIVEQCAKAALRFAGRVQLAVADALGRQPAGWHLQDQPLALAVVVAVQTGNAVQCHFGAILARQLEAGRLQVGTGHVQAPGALLYRHQLRAAHLVDHQFEKQRRIGDHFQGRRRWRQFASQ